MFFYMSIVNHFWIIGVILYHVISVSFCRYTQPDKHFETLHYYIIYRLQNSMCRLPLDNQVTFLKNSLIHVCHPIPPFLSLSPSLVSLCCLGEPSVRAHLV